MASDAPHGGSRTESCENCCRETPHTVTVELWVERTSDEDAPFARQPHRLSTCRECGTESVQSMDDV